MVVTISHEGYVKRNPVGLYRAQRRGGRGKIGATTRDEDFVEHLFVASTHSYLLFFTSTGKVYWLKVARDPTGGSRRARPRRDEPAAAQARGEAVGVPTRPRVQGRLAPDLRDAARSREEDRSHAVLLAAPERAHRDRARGRRRGGRRARSPTAQSEVILSTADGQAIRFEEVEVRPMGRVDVRRARHDARRGRPARRRSIWSRPARSLLAVAENGYGKRTEMDEYRQTHRGGQGHHHHEDDRQDRSRDRGPHGDGRGPDHARLERRQGGPHAA